MNAIAYVISMGVSTILTLAVFVPAAAAESSPSPQSLDLERVALFKNGLTFFVGRVECPAGETSFDVALPTAPSHGTFWVSYAPDVPVINVVAAQVDSGRTVEAATIPEMLAANVGRNVRLVVGDKELTGVITYVAPHRAAPVPNPYEPGHVLTDPAYGHPWQPPGLMLLETEAGEVSINPATVTQATFLQGKASRRFTEPGRSVVLRVRLKSPAGGQPLTVSYLGKGATWAPSYMVDITDGRTARLSAKALIVNDACELRDLDAQLVTGFPHLQFADIVSPIALKEDLAQFLQAVSQGQSERGRADIMSNVMTQSVHYGGVRDAAAMPAYGAAEAGTTAEDLFLYPAGRISLNRSEVAYVPLFTEAVPCKHIYQWDIPDYVNEEGRYEEQPARGDKLQQVWHSVRLTNTTRVPWTTAPGQTVKDGIILGQDTLGYTPAGGESTLRITQAVSVKAEQRELETDRKREAAQFYGWQYDLITVRGELAVTNFQTKAITLEITKTLSGELKSSDPEARLEKLAAGLRRMNGLAKLTWTLQLEPGQKHDVSYQYEVYIRR